MLARGTAAEVFGRYEDIAAETGIVQRKTGYGLPRLIITPIAEQVVAKPFAFNCFEETGRNNLVGIDVVTSLVNFGIDITLLFFVFC